jgi:tetratricopeptide (TPR) repeat protein
MKKVLQILHILGLISIMPIIFIIINYYANGGTLFDSIKEVFKVFLGLLVIVGIPGLIGVFMSDASKEKNNKAYKIFNEINGISILFIIVFGLVFFIPIIRNAIPDLKISIKKDFYWFIVFIISIIFSGYWWLLKKGANYLVDGSEQYKIGLQYFKDRNINQALKHFDISIKNGYKDADAFYKRADCLTDLKFYSEAIENYNKAIEINSEKADMYRARYFCKHEIGDFYGALSDLQEAIRVSKLDNENNRFWNEYAKETGWSSATARYEMDFRNAEISLEIFKERELLDIPESKIELDKTKANHQLNKERNRHISLAKETKTILSAGPEKDEEQSNLTPEERKRKADLIRSLKSKGN